MKLKTGIEKAIKKGWYYKPLGVKDGKNYSVIIHQKHAILLDVDFWLALENTEKDGNSIITWNDKMHFFVQYLIDRMELEEAFDLATE